MGEPLISTLHAVPSSRPNRTNAHLACNILPHLTDRLANRSQDAYNS